MGCLWVLRSWGGGLYPNFLEGCVVGPLLTTAGGLMCVAMGGTCQHGLSSHCGSVIGSGWGQEKVSQALTSPDGCVTAGGGALAERRHSEEEHVPPSSHRLPAV